MLWWWGSLCKRVFRLKIKLLQLVCSPLHLQIFTIHIRLTTAMYILSSRLLYCYMAIMTSIDIKIFVVMESSSISPYLSLSRLKRPVSVWDAKIFVMWEFKNLNLHSFFKLVFKWEYYFLREGFFSLMPSQQLRIDTYGFFFLFNYFMFDVGRQKFVKKKRKFVTNSIGQHIHVATFLGNLVTHIPWPMCPPHYNQANLPFWNSFTIVFSCLSSTVGIILYYYRVARSFRWSTSPYDSSVFVRLWQLRSASLWVSSLCRLVFF